MVNVSPIVTNNSYNQGEPLVLNHLMDAITLFEVGVGI
jgi:hypothetical protein